MDANVRECLKLPERPQWWQNHRGNRSVIAAVQRAIVDQNRIGWDKFLASLLSTRWGIAQTLYQEQTGDYPKQHPRTWAKPVINLLWEFTHEVWLYRNAIKHGVTMAEQQQVRRDRVVMLVTDRYKHQPHLDAMYKFLYNKALHKRLEDGNRALYPWLTSVANLSSLSTKPAAQQQSPWDKKCVCVMSDTGVGN